MKLDRIAGLFLLLIVTRIASAQDCVEFFPGDCPDTTSINSTFSVKQNLDEGISASVAAMKDSARKVLLHELNRISKKENWSLMELDDYFGYGPLLAVPSDLEDEKRPPVQYGVVFQFMFNPDSLKVAKKWREDFYQKVVSFMSTDTAVTMQNYRSHKDEQQQRQDSALYYGALEQQYAQANATAYQNAILSNDQKFIDRYNKQMDYYNKKMNGFVNDANKESDKDQSRLEEDQNSLDRERYNAKVRFRNACVLQVAFECHAGVSSVPDEAKETVPQTLQVSGVTKAFLFQNSEPSFSGGNIVYDGSKGSWIAMLLFGPWVPAKDGKYSYNPAFIADRKNFDSETVKKIPGNKIQNISIHVSGQKDYVMKFIRDFDASKINQLITVSQ